MTVGRSSACDIKLSGSDISSKHCLFSLSVNNRKEYLILTDTSSNGTFVDGEPVGKDSTVLLRSGDRLQFAQSSTYIFRYLLDGQENMMHSFFDDYILHHQLGSGHYAVVREGRDRTTGNIVAVKIFHPNKTRGSSSDEEEKKLMMEMNLLLSISHPNIVGFIAHYVEPINEYSSTTYLVLEKVNSGELFQRIINKKKLGQEETKALYRQLLGGLKYLHEKEILHRDIKPENILLDITPRTDMLAQQTGPWDDNELDIRVKIADFGLAKFIGERKFTNTLCGTPAYVAPEVLNNNQNYSTKVDIWLAGVLLYVCLCGFPPFSDELGPPSMREQILLGKYAFYSPYWDEISDSALDLISNLLIVDPLQRFNIQQAINHLWFLEESDTSFERIESEHERPILDTQPVTILQKYTSDLQEQKKKQTLMTQLGSLTVYSKKR